MKKSTINVLFLVPNLRVANGVASYAINYFRLLRHEGVHVDFVLFREAGSPYYDEIKDAGCSYYVMPEFRHPLKHVKACRKIIREGHYDIVHDNTLLVSVPLMWTAKLRRVPVRILHSHSARLGETPHSQKRNKCFMSILRASANARAACSDVAAKNMFGDKDYYFVPNIVAEDKLHFSEEKREEVRKARNAGDKKIIGTVGRIAPPKNPMFALEIFKALLSKGSDVEYWWIGSGALDEEFKTEVEKLGLSDRVKILGNRTDVPDLYQGMDLFLLPSLFEGMPVTGIEAQVMGLPCVVSDTITKDMVFTDLVNFVSLEKSAEEWADVVLNILKQKPERRSHKNDLEKSPFSEKEAGKRLADIYRELLKAKGR